MAPYDRNQRAPRRRRPLANGIRPGHCSAVQIGARVAGSVARVGLDRVSDARVARRAFGSAVGNDRGANGGPRTMPDGDRGRRRRPCADAARCRADRTGARIPARIARDVTTRSVAHATRIAYNRCAMPLTLNLPPLDPRPANPPETRPTKVAEWLAESSKRDDVQAALVIERTLHQTPIASGEPELTPERVYLQALLLALANPYGFLPGQLNTVLRYLQEYSHWAKLTNVAPVHRMAKAVAIVPVGHDFPPFSANKGGSIDGSKIFLLTFDLAFQLQEQIRAVEGGGDVPGGIGKDPSSRLQYLALLRRLLRQWAIPPARQFNRLPSRARVVMCAGLSGVWQYSRGLHAGVSNPPTGLPPMTSCQVINHTPAGYALRQIDAHPAVLRIGDLIALRVEGRSGLQVAAIRWFRNTLKGSGLEFGCELLSDSPEAAAAAAEGSPENQLTPVVVLPEDAGGSTESLPQLLVPAGTFDVEQAVSLRRGKETGFAVLTKLAEQGPGYELYEFAAV